MVEIAEYRRDDLALEATRRDGRERLRIERFPEVAVVLGRGSKPEVELNLDAVEKDGVKVYRRRGGGCSVVLDPGNVIVSLFLPLPGLGGIKAAFEQISNRIIDALARLGIGGVRQRGVSDLALGDRKIGGSCIYRSRDLLHYGTTLLVDPQIEKVSRYLAHPPREPDYRRGRTHEQFMGSLAGRVGKVEDFVRALETELVIPVSAKTRESGCWRDISCYDSRYITAS